MNTLKFVNTIKYGRAHTIGDFFPFRVMAVGLPTSLAWHVMKPNGTLYGIAFDTANACAMARLAYADWGTL